MTHMKHGIPQLDEPVGSRAACRQLLLNLVRIRPFQQERAKMIFPTWTRHNQHSRRPGRVRERILAKAWLFVCIVFALSARAAEPAAQAQTADLTELPLEALMNLDVPKVYGASKIEQNVTDAPSSVTVVPAEEIKKYGHRTLGDVLRSVQGFNISYDRNYQFIGTRGISLGDFNSRVLLLVNGHRVNNNLTDGAFVDSAFILDLDLVDRVEVIRGPGSVLYGNNAFFGVINVITREGKQLNGLEVSGEYGSYDAYKGRLTYGKLFTNGLQLMLSGSYYDNSGPERLYYLEFDTPAQNNGIAENMDGDTVGSFFGTLSYQDFTLEGAYNHRKKTNPTAQFDLTTFNDPRLRTIDQRSYAALKYSHSFPKVVDVTAQLYYDGYTHDIGYPQSLIVGTNVLFSGFTSEENVGQWWGAELQLNKTLWDRHTVTLGGEFRDDFEQVQRISGQTPLHRSRQSHAVYVQGDFAVLTNLHLNAGLRYDQYGDFDPSFNPRLGLIYTPVKGSTLKALYGTAFRAPNFTELSDPRFPDVQPEEITGYELVYEQEIGKHLRSSLSGFYNQMDRLIVFDSGTYGNFDAETAGMEVALEGAWPNGIRGRTSYSFQSTRNHSIDWDVPDSPQHLVKLNLSVPLMREKVFAGIEYQFVSTRGSLHNTVDSANQPLTVQGRDAGSYSVLNLTLFSQNLIKNLEFSASVYNILNHHYSDPSSRFHVQDKLEQNGRTFRLKLTYRF
jgi:iron complex outermembrane receptor protein